MKISMDLDYSLEDLCKSYNWLGHGVQYTELVAAHPLYRPGKNNKDHNDFHDAWTKIDYAQTLDEVIEFANLYSSSHLVMYGLNPRPKKFYLEKDDQFYRKSRDNEITTAQSILFDFDFSYDVNSFDVIKDDRQILLEVYCLFE